MKEVTASTELVCVKASGDRLSVTVQVGKPYPAEGGDWICVVSLRGVLDRPVDIRGEDSLQALSLAIAFCVEFLADFTKDGGRVLYPSSDEDFPLQAYFWALRDE